MTTALTECPFCGMDLIHEHLYPYGIDILANTGEGDCFCTWTPCCLDMREQVGIEGWEAVHGQSLEEFLNDEYCLGVLEVELEDSCIVCRLAVDDPAIVTGEDGKGHKKTKGPRGWQREVFDAVEKHHRHHKAPQGWKFGLAALNGGIRIGVATVGNPVSRMLCQTRPDTLEVTRVCTWGRSPLRKNASSKLYAAAAKRARQMGYSHLITYTLAGEESGHSLLASGWTPTSQTTGGSWNREGRERQDKAPTCSKIRWERGLSKKARKEVASRRIEVQA